MPCFLRSESFDTEVFSRILSSQIDNVHKKSEAALVQVKYLQNGSRPFHSFVEIVLER